MKQRFSYSYLLLIPLVLRSTMPFLSLRLRLIIPFIFSVIWLFVQKESISVAINHNRKLYSAFLAFSFATFIYKLMPFLYTFFGYGKGVSGTLYGTFLNTCLMLSTAFIPCVLITCEKRKEMFMILSTAFVGLLLTGLRTLFVSEDVIALGSARAGVLYGQGDASSAVLDVATESAANGLGNYDYIYACAFIVPISIFSLFKLNLKWMRIALILVITACMASIRAGGLGTPVIVMLVGVVLSLSAAFVKRTKIIKLLGFTMVTTLVIFTYHPTFFSFMAPPFRVAGFFFETEKEFAYRCRSIADSLEGRGGETYAAERYQLQRLSIKTFFSSEMSFFVGIGNYKGLFHPKIGGHSTICDHLAYYGIFGIFLFISYILSYCRFYNLLTSLSSTDARMVMPILFGMYIFAAYANPVERFDFVLILAPLLPFFYRDNKIGKNLIYRNTIY